MLFRLKFWLQRQWMRLWPLLVVLVLCLLVLQNGQIEAYQYHPSSLGKVVFAVSQTVFEKPLLALAQWMGVEGDETLGMVFVAVGTVAIIIGFIILLVSVIASNGRLSRRLASWLKRRPRAVHTVVVTSMFQRYTARTRQQKSTMAEKQKKYVQLLQYELPSVLPKLPDIEVTLFDQGYRREAWRMRRVYHVQAVARLPFELPRMILIPKRLDSEKSSINDLLGNVDNFVRLEGDFSDVFDLYVARGYELYALQILNPSVILRLMRHAPEAWIELDGTSIAILQMGLPTSPAEFEAFETLSTTVLTILEPYVTQQMRRSTKPAQRFEKFPAEIRLRPLISDRLLYAATGLLVLAGLTAVISQLFTPLATTSRNSITGGLLTSPTVWGDTLEAIALLIIITMLIAMLAGEIEARLRHLKWRYLRRRAIQAHGATVE